MTDTSDRRQSAHRLSHSGHEPFEACPDGGRCWHNCPLAPATDTHPEGEGLPCARVRMASPLGRHGEAWTTEERVRHGAQPAAVPGLPTTVDLTSAAAWVVALQTDPVLGGRDGDLYRGALGVWALLTGAPNDATAEAWALQVTTQPRLTAHSTPF